MEASRPQIGLKVVDLPANQADFLVTLLTIACTNEPLLERPAYAFSSKFYDFHSPVPA
jgi:hypothetical protein